MLLLAGCAALHAQAQFGVGITIPMGRSTHRLGTVPDSLAVHAPKELDIRPRCLLHEDEWLASLLRNAPCDSIPLGPACRMGAMVTLRFTVERDGTVSDLIVVKGGCPALEARAQCALAEAPPWEPGRIGHHKVRTRMQVRSPILPQ